MRHVIFGSVWAMAGRASVNAVAEPAICASARRRVLKTVLVTMAFSLN
jgi:hypothetical protein